MLSNRNPFRACDNRRQCYFFLIVWMKVGKRKLCVKRGLVYTWTLSACELSEPIPK